jgi:hypothetical protein
VRVSIRGATVSVACAGVLAWVAFGGAGALATTHVSHCDSVRTDRFYHPAAHGLFGAYSISATGTRCGTARTIASKYVRDPFSVDSPAHRTKKVAGWSCTWRSNLKVAQQVSVICRKPRAEIAFADRLPSG